jgi:hypothetical protein
MLRLKKILPLVILVTAVAIPMVLPMSARVRAGLIVDTGQTRLVVNQTLAKLQALQPASLDDESLRRSVREAANSQYVASLWLFTPEGRIVYQAGSEADPARFYDWATGDTVAIMNALPKGVLSKEQKGALMAAAALRGVGGGDHNWIWNPAVSPLKSPDGQIVGWLGALYDISSVSPARPTVKLMSLFIAVLLLLAAYWLSVPAWVYLDAKQRGERAWVWALFALIGNLAALLAYLLVRKLPELRTKNEER